MCGIAGYKLNNPIEKSVLNQMVDSLYHRGPDSEGFYNTNGYNVGMRRLSINDLHTGDQPLYNENKDIVLIYNGEIYNYSILRELLEKNGHKFRSQSDGEVVCHLYEDYGEDLFDKLDGMYAIALWVESEKKLILGRDIPGEKPLYYSCISDTEIVFASEIKSLQKFPGLCDRLDYQSIWDFPTFLWIPEPATIYKNIKALMPGNILIVNNSGFRIKKINNRLKNEEIATSEKEMIERTKLVVEEAVKSRLLSDVPVGSFLSSGLDSSLVTNIANRHLGQLDTFTIGFEDIEDPYHGQADESAFSMEYAKKLGTNHHTIPVSAKTFNEQLEEFCYYGDQPFAISSGLGLLSVAKAAADAGVKVLLSGDGADELFGGYSWYKYLPLANNGSPVSISSEFDISFQNHKMSLDERIKHLAGYNAHKRAWAWHYYASENEKRKLFSTNLANQVDSSLRFFKQFNSNDVWDEEDFVKQDRQFYLPNEMLKKMDRMTMAYSVEGRAPFVAPSVLSHAENLKYYHLNRNGELKWILRKAFQDILPQKIINRPKHGFNVPIDHWLKSKWSYLVNETFSKESALRKHGFISKNSFKVAKSMLSDSNRLNGHSIFCFIMLNRWLEKNL